MSRVQINRPSVSSGLMSTIKFPRCWDTPTAGLKCNAAANLPPEILSKIFQEVQFQCRPRPPCSDERGRFGKTPFLGLFRWIPEVTHVCSSWREIALANPTLWTSNFGMSHKWAQECFRRAKDVPFDLSFATPWPRSSIQTVFARPDKIRSIHLPVSKDDYQTATQLLWDMLNTSSLPSLVTLSLAASYKPWCLPENLLDPPVCVPKLERLVLNNCTLNLRTPRFRFLRALEIEFGYGDRDRNMLAIFDMIEYLSNLEDVRLKNVTHQANYRGALDSRSFFKGRNLRTFVFPRLRSLEIENNSATPVFYLSCVSAPAISRVFLSKCALHYPTEIEPLYTFASFDFTSPTCEDPYIHDLAISKRTADGDFYDDGYLTLEHNQYRSSDNTLVKTLRIDSIQGNHLDSLWAAIPSGELRNFTLYYDAGLSSFTRPRVSLPNMMFSLVNLEKLTTLSFPYLVFIESIPSFLSARSGPAFPSLRKLVLDCYAWQPEDHTFSMLEDWLVEREKEGLERVQSLSIVNVHYLGAGITEMLGKLVGDFRVSLKLSACMRKWSV